MNKLISLFLVAVLIPVTHFTHIFVNESYNTQNIKVEVRYNLPSPEIMKVVTLGYDNFIADILWLQAIQYVGSTNDISVLLHELYSLINTVITLNPQFIEPYIFGAYALSDNKEFEKAVNILEKGVKNNPEEWYLSYQLGFLYYIKKKNKLATARYLEKASEIPGSPLFLKQLAATLYSKEGNDLDISIRLWQSVYDKAKEEGDKINLEKAYKKLVELKIEKDLQALREAIKKYDELTVEEKEIVNPDQVKDEREGKQEELKKNIPKRPPLTELKMLTDAGILEKLPIDPFNRPYLFDEKAFRKNC